MGQNVQEACWVFKVPNWLVKTSGLPDKVATRTEEAGKGMLALSEGREAYTGSPYLCSS